MKYVIGILRRSNLFEMAGSFSIVSYNMHGFGQGRPLLSDLCLSSDIICVQEHWLLPDSLINFNEFSSDFVGFSTSAMDAVSGKGILRGRPFGGVGVLVNRRHAHKVKCLATAERYLILFVHDLIIVNLYLPVCKDVDMYKNCMLDIMSGVGLILDQYSDYPIIVAGDLNCDLVTNNSGGQILNEFMNDYNLSCCDDLFDSVTKYTYKHASLNHQSFVDHFLVSSTFKGTVRDCLTVDSGSNLSDHLPIMLLVSLPDTSAMRVKQSSRNVPRPSRLRWDKADLIQYYNNSLSNFSNLIQYENIKVNDDGVCSHISMIAELHSLIVESFKMSANSCVPRTANNFFKHWWDEELKDLKAKSIDAHVLWKSCGCPLTGDVYHLKRTAKALYKLAIRQKNTDEIVDVSNDLHEYLLQKDQPAFWKSWSSKFCSKVKPSEVVDGENDMAHIANNFAAVFEQACTSNCAATSDKLYEEYFRLRPEYIGSVTGNVEVETINTELITKCIQGLKLGKAAGLDEVEPEHIVYAHPVVQSMLATLFNSILYYGYVPREFGSGIIIPIIKDKSGDKTSSCNYRGITLSSNIAKLFELCLLDLYSSFLYSSDLQFGFKKKSGCNSAIYAARSVIEYFTKHGSTVNVCLLDMSKAFDKVNHHGLYIKLMKRNLPIKFLDVIIDWYSKCYATVQWNGCFSKCFSVLCGVRQGGVLSPIMFTVYVDDIIVDLKSSNEGCCIDGLYLGCVMYADDLMLLSASLSSLQRMLNICLTAASYLDIAFNVKKSMIIRIGQAFRHVCDNVTLHGLDLPFVEEAKYLGVYIVTGKRFRVKLSEPISKFFKSVNSILSKCKGHMNEVVLLNLLSAYCKPLLCYACECIDFLKSEYSRLFNAWNSIYWKIFQVNDQNCISDICRFSGFLPLSVDIDIRKYVFLCKLPSTGNSVLSNLYNMFGRVKVVELAEEYNVTIGCTYNRFKTVLHQRLL